MKKSSFCLLTIFGIIVLAGSSSLLWAQCQDQDIICVDLSFDKGYYNYGESIGVTVVVRNNSGRDVYISKGFSEKDYYLEMRVIDPAGRLILARRLEEHGEFPDAPPLPFCVKNNGVFTQVTLYEVLPPGWSKTSMIEDLRNYYSMKFPGNYSFQVQLSAMIWDSPPEEPCIGDINNYEFLGVLTSETKYIDIEGSTEVYIIPNEWLISWKDEQIYPRPELSATIWPEEGKTVDDYSMDYIQMNNLKATSVFKDYSYTERKYYLRAFFDRKDAINTLGNVVAGKRYPVAIFGTLKGGGFFGGGRKVKIINY